MSTVNNMQIQDDEGNVFHPETSIEQIVGENGTQVFPGGKPGNMESSNMAVAFEEAKTRENIKSGEKHRVLFGKIQKFFTDLKAVAFSGKYGDLSERPTLGGAAGYKVADNDTTNNSEFLTTARVAYEHGLEIDALSRDFAGGQMEIRLTEAGKGEYRKKGADSWVPFRSEIRIINIFLPPHRDNWGHMDIDVSEYSTLFIGSVTTSGNHAAEIIGDDVLIGSYKHGDKNITVDISGIRQLRFRNGLKATDWSRYADFGNIIIS